MTIAPCKAKTKFVASLKFRCFLRNIRGQLTTFQTSSDLWPCQFEKLSRFSRNTNLFFSRLKGFTFSRKFKVARSVWFLFQNLFCLFSFPQKFVRFPNYFRKRKLVGFLNHRKSRSLRVWVHVTFWSQKAEIDLLFSTFLLLVGFSKHILERGISDSEERH